VRSASKKLRAFTLVELLVVIGIIAVLISILLPVVKGARRQARLVECASNLRNLVQACQMHAQEHGGFLPLAGTITMPTEAAWQGMPWGVNDSLRRRYGYAKIAGTTVFAFIPLPGALAPYLGVTDLPSDDFYAFDRALNARDGVWRRFMCPDSDALEKAKLNDDPNDNNVVDQGMMLMPMAGSASQGWWATNSDYGLNEGVFGFHADSRYAENRLAGNLSRIRRTSEVALFTDAIPRKQLVDSSPSGWITWTPSLNGSGTATLGDAFAGNGRVEAPDMFDRNRHSKRMNVGFADGHVETVLLTKEALDRVYVLPQP